MKLYFAYGSNMWIKQMNNRCTCHRFFGNGILTGYRWIISSRGYANIVKSPSDWVCGVVYEISESDENSLDIFEGLGNGLYRKELLNVEVDGFPKNCLTYIDPIKKEGLPKAEYIKRINLGIQDAKLSSDYVKNYIRKFIPA
jgi:gamma-glutamylcyclotransferase (GGCT)/AIG2-like uncharacterized protein YtfP